MSSISVNTIAGVAWFLLLPGTGSTTEPVFNNPELDSFVEDLADPDNIRHYNLVSKQAAIHKWHIRSCMAELGLSKKNDSDSEKWNHALHGKYAYCQDHHIPGIDPPCPAEDVVMHSVNGSCWQLSHDKINWSHDIMHAARRGMPQTWQISEKDNPGLRQLESAWSDCMESEGYQFRSRFEMFSSFGEAADLSVEEQAVLPDRELVMQSGEHCFQVTNYYEQRNKIADTLRERFFASRRGKLESALEQYMAAEHHADKAIHEYCRLDREFIVSEYNQENYSQNEICN